MSKKNIPKILLVALFVFLSILLLGSTFEVHSPWTKSGTNVYLQNSTDNVGIGTNSPGNKFHIEDSISGAFIAKIKNTHATNGYGLLVIAGDDDNVEAIRVEDKDGTDLFRVKGGGKSYFKQNVGIGISDPNGPLHVDGNVYVSEGECYFDGNIYVIGDIKIKDNRVIGFNSSSGRIEFDNQVTDEINILSANFGIGTNSPDTSLDLSGTLSYTPSATQLITNASETVLANAALIILDPNNNYTLTSTPTIADGSLGQIVRIICDNTEANIVTFQDQDALAGTNLQLGAAGRAISGKDELRLLFDGTDWIEDGYHDN